MVNAALPLGRAVLWLPASGLFLEFVDSFGRLGFGQVHFHWRLRFLGKCFEVRLLRAGHGFFQYPLLSERRGSFSPILTSCHDTCAIASPNFSVPITSFRGCTGFRAGDVHNRSWRITSPTLPRHNSAGAHGQPLSGKIQNPAPSFLWWDSLK